MKPRFRVKAWRVGWRSMFADDLGDPMLIINPFRAKLRAIKPKAAPALALATQPLPAEPDCGVGADIDLTPPEFLCRAQVPA